MEPGVPGNAMDCVMIDNPGRYSENLSPPD